MMYAVVKHENLVDTDEVTVICVTDTKEKAFLQLLMEAHYMNTIQRLKIFILLRSLPMKIKRYS